MATAVTSVAGLHTTTGLTASENSDSIETRGGGLNGAVQVLDGGGSGFNSGTVTIQASLDGTNWYTVKDLQGTAITFAADGAAEFTSAARYFRASADGSISDVDVIFSILG